MEGCFYEIFVCSLCHNGILESAIVSLLTNKLTVDKKYRNLVLPMQEIKEIGGFFPIATVNMKMENYINSLFSINHALQNGFKILDKYKVSNSLSGRCEGLPATGFSDRVARPALR